MIKEVQVLKALEKEKEELELTLKQKTEEIDSKAGEISTLGLKLQQEQEK